MVKPTKQKIIARAKREFARDLFAADYDAVHVDRGHLLELLDLCPVAPGARYLDLGTGNGDLAFALAGRHADVLVTGVDIVPEAVTANKSRARRGGFSNVEFVLYDGIRLPFGDRCCAGVLCRYAFHHFPEPAPAAAEMFRILEPGGSCVIADPVAAGGDHADFINRFAALKDDGHVRFHDCRERRRIFGGAGFEAAAETAGSIRFPRDLNPAYRTLIEDTPRSILDVYDVTIDGARVYVTVPVLNTRFRRPA